MTAIKHGHTLRRQKTRAYVIWSGMRQRCSNQNRDKFAYYGGRGITVCVEWSSFVTFLSDMGEPPPGMSLDRINNDGPYCKANCRWASRSMQTKNSSQGNVIEFQGEALNVCDWEERLGISQGAIRRRLKRGWSIAKALTTPNVRAIERLTLGEQP
jgi:hypothetical protein